MALHRDPSPRWWAPWLVLVLALPAGALKDSFSDWHARIHPDDLTRVRSALKRTLKDHTPFHLEHRIARRLIRNLPENDAIAVLLVLFDHRPRAKHNGKNYGLYGRAQGQGQRQP